jgi:hypothetical protein
MSHIWRAKAKYCPPIETPMPNSSLHLTAARVRMLLNPKGHGMGGGR